MIKVLSPLRFYIYLNILFYVFPAIISLFFFRGEYVNYTLELLFFFVISVMFFYLGYVSNKSSYKYLTKRKININEFKIMKMFVIFYCFLLFFIYYNNPPPLFYIFSGDFQLINELRAYATKGKVGFDSFVNFIYFTFSYALLPAYLLVLYARKSKYRHYFLILFSFFLMLNMQKARLLYLLIPLLFFSLSIVDPSALRKKYKKKKKKIIFFLVLFFIFLIVVSNYSGFNSDNFRSDLSGDLFERSTTGSRFLFSDFNSLTFVINRIIWISYITMVDWLDFFHTSVSHYLHGATIPGVYKVLGHEVRYQIENEVFKYSYLSGDGSMGTANTHFILDAFVNFGYLGIIVYSFISGFLVSMIYKHISYPANFISYNYVYSLAFSSLHANLLGGGIWLLILIIIFKRSLINRRTK